MEYKLTFEDGSSAYLAHHGVKGQRWGVLNEKNAKEYAKYGRRVGHKKGGGIVEEAGKSLQAATSKKKKANVRGKSILDAAGKSLLKKKKKKKGTSLGKHNKLGVTALSKRGQKMYANSSALFNSLRSTRLAKEDLKRRSY